MITTNEFSPSANVCAVHGKGTNDSLLPPMGDLSVEVQLFDHSAFNEIGFERSIVRKCVVGRDRMVEG